MIRLLDTNVCIAWLKGGDSKVLRRVEQHIGSLHLCSVVKAELLYGARKSRHVNSNLARLDAFFAELPSLPFDDAAAEHYGVLRAGLEMEGQPIGPNDLMVAAIAKSADSVLVTRNHSEFRRIAGLRIENW